MNREHSLVPTAAAYVCLGGITLDWLWGLRQEMDLIWHKESQIPYIKCLFAVSRYFGLAVQICHTIGLHFIGAANPHHSPHVCRTWIGFQVLTSVTLLVPLEFVLGMRVYALYERNFKIAVFLTVLFLAEFGIVIGCATSGLLALEFLENTSCIPRNVPLETVYLTSMEILTQIIILILTLYKYLTTQVEFGWKKIPLLSLVTRDGTWVFLVVCVILVATISDAIVAKFAYAAAHMCDMVFPLFAALLSYSNCHIIMNMQIFWDSSRARPVSEFQLTSVMEWVGVRTEDTNTTRDI